MWSLVYWQFALVAGLTPFVWLFWGVVPAVSLLLGGLSYALPTVCSVAVLSLFRQPEKTGTVFLISEGLKTALALILIVLSLLLYRELDFPVYLLGFLLSSHLVFLLFLRIHRYGK